MFRKSHRLAGYYRLLFLLCLAGWTWFCRQQKSSMSFYVKSDVRAKRQEVVKWFADRVDMILVLFDVCADQRK